MADTSDKIWAHSALLATGWSRNVEITCDSSGNIIEINSDVPYQSGLKLNGTLLPGIPNLHSHAHQRAMTGLAEHLDPGGGNDSFWSWRELMYRLLDRITPDHLYNIASQLYIEMLKAGYTSVAEFQYLHHDIIGQPYANRAEMTSQCVAAAVEVGLGITALPVLYGYSGFNEQPPLPRQKRFINSADQFIDLYQQLLTSIGNQANTAIGIAPHSLRAVSKTLLQGVLNGIDSKDVAALHLHIAEQELEVEQCLDWSGQRPLQWLFNHFDITPQWCLVHATWMDANETRQLADSGAVAGLCPTTEANLGDGFFNALEYHRHEGNWGIGSDSQVSCSPVEELRWLEYGQRLQHRTRNPLATHRQPHSGRHLLDAALGGGAQACGRRIGQIATGYRADFIVIDDQNPRLNGQNEDNLLDSWIFASTENPVSDVFVGGRQVIREGHHDLEDVIHHKFKSTLLELATA